MTFAEMTNIPTPSYLMPGNMISFSIITDNGWDDEYEGIGMITSIDHDYCAEEFLEIEWSNVRYCMKIQCNDGKVRNASLYYTRVDHQSSPAAVQFEDGLYEPDDNLDGGSTLIIHEVFDC